MSSGEMISLPNQSGDARRCHYHQVLVSRDLGGGEFVALSLAEFVRKKGFRSVAWIPGHGPAWSEAKKRRLSLRPYNWVQVANRGEWTAAIGNLRLSYALYRSGLGIVHVHSPLHYGAMQWALRLSRHMSIAHVHIEDRPAALRWAFKHPPDLIITCARFLEKHVRLCLPARFQESQRIVAVPNAVNTVRFSPGNKSEAKAQLGAIPDKPLLLMLANLAPHKGQETAIRAVALLKKRCVDVTCWLAGAERGQSDAYATLLRSLAVELGVSDRVRLLGHRSDTPKLLRAADMLLLPSTNEGLPLSILEAQASKALVLAAPTAGIPEIVEDGKTGFLIAADNPMEYANRISELLRNDTLSHRIVDDAYVNTITNYDSRAYHNRIWELYQELTRTLDKNGSVW
jgi:glycosyltransferase involved in cell wall biosynthesis